MRIALALAACALAAACPAAARERLVAQGPVKGLEAGGGWVTWVAGDSRVYLHDGERTAAPADFTGRLGTDAFGRGVALDVGCDSLGCRRLNERLLPNGPSTTALMGPNGIWTADESRGALLVGVRGADNPTGIYLRERGESDLRRVTHLRPGTVAISTGAMTNQSRGERIYAAGRRSPDRWRLIVKGDVDSATADGHWAYWLQDHERIMRLNPGVAHRRPEAFVPPRRMSSLAVTRATLYYVDGDTRDLYAYSRPGFVRTGQDVPIGR
jgi:hypothetical protein